MFFFSIIDCNTPSETGYEFTGTSATTYLGTSNTACATGYKGIASPAQVHCEANGTWTIVTGCNIKGKNIIFWRKFQNQWMIYPTNLAVHLLVCPSTYLMVPLNHFSRLLLMSKTNLIEAGKLTCLCNMLPSSNSLV